MSNNEKCPKCGVAIVRNEVIYRHYKCDTFMNFVCGTWVVGESVECLRNQLATAIKERDEAREAGKSLVRRFDWAKKTNYWPEPIHEGRISASDMNKILDALGVTEAERNDTNAH